MGGRFTRILTSIMAAVLVGGACSPLTAEDRGRPPEATLTPSANPPAAAPTTTSIAEPDAWGTTVCEALLDWSAEIDRLSDRAGVGIPDRERMLGLLGEAGAATFKLSGIISDGGRFDERDGEEIQRKAGLAASFLGNRYTDLAGHIFEQPTTDRDLLSMRRAFFSAGPMLDEFMAAELDASELILFGREIREQDGCEAAFATGHDEAARPQPPALTGDERWQQDIDYLTTGIAKRHADPFTEISEESWLIAAADLRARVPSLTEEDLVVEMARLVALLGDAHTSLQPAQFSGEAWLPLRFRWFSDGLFITEASYEHRDLLGAEVLSFGPTSAEDAHQLLAPLISHDNEVWLRETSPGLMAVPFVLRQAGVIPDETNISLAIRRRDGVETQATIRPSLGAARAPLKTLPRESEMPGYLSGRFENYWFERVAGGSALYIRYAAMHEDPGLSIADFTRGVMEEFDGAPVERVIIDVRQNGGGFATVSNTMRLALENRNSDRALRVYVLIDGGTFSAAKNAAITFRESLKAITVGEPTGGSPTEYTGVRRLTLPNHGVSLIYSSGRVAFPGYDQPSLMPDLPVAWTSSDYFEGRDAALEAALKHER